MPELTTKPKTKSKTNSKSKTVLTNKIPRLPTVGWREWVALPELGISKIKVKVDSGARTSALHATEIQYLSIRGKNKVRFKVSPNQDTTKGAKTVTADLIGKKIVKSSIGISTKRPTISTLVQIGEYHYPIKVTLINRDVMGFRMLLGRGALRKRFLVDCGKSFCQSKRTASKK